MKVIQAGDCMTMLLDCTVYASKKNGMYDVLMSGDGHVYSAINLGHLLKECERR